MLRSDVIDTLMILAVCGLSIYQLQREERPFSNSAGNPFCTAYKKNHSQPQEWHREYLNVCELDAMYAASTVLMVLYQLTSLCRVSVVCTAGRCVRVLYYSLVFVTSCLFITTVGVSDAVILRDVLADMPEGSEKDITLYMMYVMSYFGIFSIFVVIVCLIYLNNFARWLRKSCRGKFKLQEMDEIYAQVATSRFNLEKFVRDYKGLLDSAYLTRRELDLMLSKYVRAFDYGKNKAGMCNLCVNKLSHDEYVFFIPGCKHIFHKKCLLDHILESITCPTCKKNIRIAMISELSEDYLQSSTSIMKEPEDETRQQASKSSLHHPTLLNESDEVPEDYTRSGRSRSRTEQKRLPIVV